MKMLFKLMPVVLALAIVPNAYANNNQKIAFVKQVYQKSVADQNSLKTIRRYATDDLKWAIDNKFSQKFGELGCVDMDYLWASQDPSHNPKKITYSVNKNGHVIANIKGEGKATIVLKKAGKSYQIDDIVTYGSPLKYNLPLGDNCK